MEKCCFLVLGSNGIPKLCCKSAITFGFCREHAKYSDKAVQKLDYNGYNLPGTCFGINKNYTRCVVDAQDGYYFCYNHCNQNKDDNLTFINMIRECQSLPVFMDWEWGSNDLSDSSNAHQAHRAHMDILHDNIRDNLPRIDVNANPYVSQPSIWASKPFVYPKF